MAHMCKSKNTCGIKPCVYIRTCEIKALHTCTYPYEVSVTNDPPYRTAWYSYGLYSIAVCVSFRLLWVFGSDPNG